MESNIVQDFQNLRVFSNHNINRMDELVQDLSQALEESSKGAGPVGRGGACQENAATSEAVGRRYPKRRRGARRAAVNVYWKRGTISEASESSLDEAVRDCIDTTIVTHSDSDDLALAYPKQRLSVPVSEPVPPVESDSFTENLSPMRPQRRRRRYKHMAVDSLHAVHRTEPCEETLPKKSFLTPSASSSTHAACSSTEQRRLSHHCAVPGSSRSGLQNFVPGKRKRSSKSRTEVVPKEEKVPSDLSTVDVENTDNMDVISVSQESSSLSSSEFDSDFYNNADEGREADDEQSDFFHDPDPAAEMTPWWDRDNMLDERMGSDQQELDAILSGALSHMSVSSQKHFKQRVDKLIARAESGREIRIGRRKLKGNMPRYTIMRFLQDRERWNSMQGSPGGTPYSPGASWNSGYSSQSGDYKRLRQTPPPPLDPTEEGYVGVDASPISETNIGNKMLRSMGWTPGSGLGPAGEGHCGPVVAYRRKGRRGLGYDTQSDT